MRILFINDILSRESVGRLPLGLLYLSASLKKAGHQTRLANSRSGREIVRAFREFSPQIVGYCLRTGYHQSYLELNRALKTTYTFFSVLGGPHATFFPETIEAEGIDAVCRGEGEDAVVDLADRLGDGREIGGLENFWIKRNGLIHKNDVRPLEADLDRLPFPDLELIRPYRNVARYPVKNFMVTRGCPYNCSYCFNHSFRRMYRGKGPVLRQRSVDNVLEEIREVRKRLPLTFVHFEDDTFALNRNWMEEFGEKYPRRIGLPFKCNLRPEQIDEELPRMLKAAGCHSVSFAIEAGNDRIRKSVLRRDVSKEQIIEASRSVRKQGIRLLILNILGLPTGSLRDDLETYDLSVACKPDLAIASLFQPYPRTDLGSLAQELKLCSLDDLDHFKTFYTKSTLDISDKKKVENLQKLFGLAVEAPKLGRLMKTMIRFPLSPLYILINRIWEGYCGKFRIVPHRLSPADYFYTLKRFLGR